MMKKIAALGLTAALAFAPMTAFAQDATPTPAATGDMAAPGAEAPAPKKMKHHMMKHHMMKHHTMKKSHKMMAPAADATPAPDAPK